MQKSILLSHPPAPAPPGQVEQEVSLTPTSTHTTLLLLHPYEIQAPEELNTRRFQTSRESILNLALSMLHDGQQEPVRVIQLPDSTYTLVFGFRRHQAACLINSEDLGGSQIPFRLQAILSPPSPRPNTPHPDLVASIVENTQRENLGPVDQAYACKLLAGHGMKQREIGYMLNLDRSLVSKRLRLLDLPADLQRQVNSGLVPIDTALLTLSPPAPLPALPPPSAQLAMDDLMEDRAAGIISDKDVPNLICENFTNTDSDILNQDSQPKTEKVPRSKTAKQMIGELTGYATPDDYNNSVGRTPAQKWILGRLIPWIAKSNRPFQKAMEELEKLVKG